MNVQAFASKTKRFQPAKAGPTALDTTDAVLAVGTPDASRVRGDPSRLGPGSYNLPDQWKTKVSTARTYTHTHTVHCVPERAEEHYADTRINACMQVW